MFIVLNSHDYQIDDEGPSPGSKTHEVRPPDA